MFSRYRSSPSLSNSIQESNTTQESDTIINEEKINTSNKWVEQQQKIQKAIEIFSETNRASFIEPYPIKHCLKKRRAIIIYAITNEIFNECYIECYNILNKLAKEFISLQPNVMNILERVKEYSLKRFNYNLKIESVKDLSQVIEEQLEYLVTSGTDTLKLRANYSRTYQQIITKVSELVKL